MLHYKNDLIKVIKEFRLPYNIDVLARIRRDCFHQNFSDPNSLHHPQVLVRFKMSMGKRTEFFALLLFHFVISKGIWFNVVLIRVFSPSLFPGSIGNRSRSRGHLFATNDRNDALRAVDATWRDRISNSIANNKHFHFADGQPEPNGELRTNCACTSSTCRQLHLRCWIGRATNLIDTNHTAKWHTNHNDDNGGQRMPRTCFECWHFTTWHQHFLRGKCEFRFFFGFYFTMSERHPKLQCRILFWSEFTHAKII